MDGGAGPDGFLDDWIHGHAEGLFDKAIGRCLEGSAVQKMALNLDYQFNVNADQ